MNFMKMQLNMQLVQNYKSNSQKIRVVTENWVKNNLYCPYCGNSSLNDFENNRPVADFFCDKCSSEYELKSKSGNIGKKISDGAYDTMIGRITSNSNPNLFVMNYNKKDYRVENLIFVPKFFFVPAIIEKRKPLAPNAKRAGWVGCNILFSEIPKQLCVYIIERGCFVEKEVVLSKINRNKALQIENFNLRGWLLDTLNCIEKTKKEEFILNDIYQFEDILKIKYPQNNNIKAKLRQQLQILRDKGIIEFLGNGKYRIL